MAKMKVALLFGGVSGEHEISCISAAAIAEHMSPEIYEVYKVGITKKGRWLLYPGGTGEMREAKWHENPDCVPAILSPDRTTRGLIITHSDSYDVVKLDMVFPALHGYGGEDGTVQGLLELAGIPYVGSGVLASAACMDKAFANRVFDTIGIPHTPWMAASREELDDFDKIRFRLGEKMRYPLCVKPAIGGSSLGVSRVDSPEELRAAAMLASGHDKTVIFEQLVVGKEVECAVLGNAEPLASKPGEIESCNTMYDYDAKYNSGDASVLHLPARLDEETGEQIRKYALRAYKAMGCTGLSRVDFFVEEGSGRVLISEINTMPGFTNISMYPKLMELGGIPFGVLVDRLILLAMERADK